MPARTGAAAALPFFSSAGTGSIASSRTLFFVPRSCLSPRIFLSCILLTFSVSWLMLYSYSRFSPSSRYSTRDSEEWTLLEQRMGGASSKKMRWSNATLISRLNCQSTSSTTPSFRGTGYNRETICFVQNLCVDAERGAWIHATEDTGEFPRVNVVAADPGSDAYYRPAVLDQFPASTYRFVDETIFLYGRDPTNGPSWTMNSLLPLHSIMSSYEGSRSSWFMRVSGQESKDNERKQQYRILDDKEQELDTYLLAPHGREIVFNPPKGKSLAAHQISPPSKSFPTCFAKAVVGLQSRCTRPYCENLIGGSDLTESLRAKVLDILSPSMARFQTADPSIVHPPSGQNVAIVSQDNLTVVEGESAPRSRIQVALLGRYGNTSIPNANALELSLLARGFAVKTIHFDRPSEISLPQAAQLFRNQSILVAPQGDALGYSTWMAPGTVVVSILPRFTKSSKIYTDRMMAFGKRFFAWDCQGDACVQPDRDLAHECIEAIQDSYEHQEGISAQDFEEFVNMKQDFRQRSAAWKAISDCYTRDVSRRINVEELTTLIEGLAKDFSFNAPSEKAKDATDGTKLARRGDLGDDEEDEEDLELETTSMEDVARTVTEGQEEEEEGEGEEEDSEEITLIQGDKEGPSENNSEDEEINIHEYDESNINETTQGAPATPTVGVETTPPLSSQPDQPVSPPTMPEEQPLSSTFELQYQTAQPIFDFAEFCKRGRCCGSAKISEEAIGSTGGKGLTPCATSMSAIVFGAKGVWGLTDELASVKESQSLVWQVDLGRS